MQNWSISAESQSSEIFSTENHKLVSINQFMAEPRTAISSALLQKFAKISPQFPGLRAELEGHVCETWCDQLTPMLDDVFGVSVNGWQMQAWYSIVTTAPEALVPMQCLPHVDGTNPNQVAMMLYLHRTTHGGTAFFRHRETGFSSLTDENFSAYRYALQADVARAGLPPKRYVTDGAPHFERIHASEGAFNQAVFYRGNILHSGVIDNYTPLPADPRTGRFSINAMFFPR